MDIQGLKDKILQLAIQGKLVEQDKNDEPASVLLQRIKEERDKLVKEGKIKKQKPLPEVTDEEKPFEIPGSWEWVRLGEVGLTQTGTTPSTKQEKYYGGSIPFVKPNDIYLNKINYDTQLKLTEEGANKGRLADKYSILMVCIGTIGKVYVTDKVCSFNQQINSLSPYMNKITHSKHLLYFMQSKCFQDKLWELSSATTIPILNKSKWESMLIPLPPLAEQKRIVEKVDQLFELIDTLDSNKGDLLEVINLTRNQVLQEAIQGKLVEPNPKDESASILLEEIKKEKEEMIKEKRIKRAKPLTEITEEDKPFEIPEGWEWVGLGELSYKIHYGYTASSKDIDTGVKMLRITDIQDGKVAWENVPYCEIEDSKINNYKLKYGDILIARTGGTIGKSFLITDIISTSVFASYLIRIELSTKMSYKYISYFLNSNLYWEQLYEKSKGTGQPNVNATSLSNLLLPLPPLEEQNRIVEKVDTIMSMLDKLEDELISNS